MRRNALLIILPTAGIALVIAGWLYFKPHAGTAGADAAFKLQAAALVEAFAIDENKANSLYNGKVLEVTGTLKDVIDERGKTVLVIGQRDASANVSCYLDDERGNSYQALKKNGKVTVKGICNGFLLDVVLDKCILLEREE